MAGTSPSSPGCSGPGPARRRFSKRQRLLRPGDFKNVFNQPIHVGSRHVTLLARANQLGYPRLGLAIAKRHVRRAVDRNRIKRQARETFRAFQGEMPGIDVVVLARPGISLLSNRELSAILQRLWRELAERCADF